MFVSGDEAGNSQEDVDADYEGAGDTGDDSPYNEEPYDDADNFDE